MDKIYKGNKGITFQVNIGQDLTRASLMEMNVKQPNGNIVTWIALQCTDPDLDQYIEYKTIESDLDQTGQYIVQPHIEWDEDSMSLDSPPFNFTVYEKFN